MENIVILLMERVTDWYCYKTERLMVLIALYNGKANIIDIVI